MNVLYTREAKGNVEEIGARLEKAVKARQFGVLNVVDLKGKMKEKGVDFGPACLIYEVCNPRRAKEVLEQEMTISTALPCRISVFEAGGRTRIATLLPTETLKLFGAPNLDNVARQVEQDIKAMIDEAAG